MQTTSRERLTDELGAQLNALLSASRALTERSAARFHPDLQPAAFHIARWLHAFGPARPSVIAEAVGMDRSSTSSLIARMRALGLVDSEPDPADRRATRISLTEGGAAQVTAALDDRGAEFYERTADWNDDDLRAFVTLLGRFVSAPPGIA